MTKQEAEILIAKYTEGSATPEERQLVEYYFHKHLVNSDDTPGHLQLQKDNKEIWKNLAGYIGEAKSSKDKLWPRIVVAAAAIAAIVVGVWFFNYRGEIASVPRNDEVVKNDIAPGKNGATITLANGKVIQLSDAKSGVVIGNGKIAYSSLRGGTTKQSPLHDEVASIPRNDVMQLTASTAKGQTYQFTLPDGTKVWLNADSKISFPSRFSGKERKILLSGEAYFEVAKLTRKPTKPIDKGTLPREKNGMERVPFMVETDQQIVEVLGTHFNVNSYADEGNTKTTLLEGSVRILYPAKGPAVPTFYRDDIVLKPNEQAVLLPTAGRDGVTRGPGIIVKEVDAQAAIDWKEGAFVFNKASLEEIMRKVTRWYDVDIVDLRKQKNEITFSGKMSRYDKISKVLSKLALTGEVAFKIEGRKIIVQ